MAALFITGLTICFELLIAFWNTLSRVFIRDRDGKRLKLQELKKSSNCLRDELQGLSPMNEFARFARVQRKLNKARSDISSLEKYIHLENAKMIYPWKIFIYFAYALFGVVILLLYRNVPCILIPKQWIFPLGSFLSFPLMLPGVVSVPVWLLICRNVSRTILSMVGK